MTFIVSLAYDYFSRVDHRPPQAETSAPEMVSHIKSKKEKDRQWWICTKKHKKKSPCHFCCVDCDNKVAVSHFDANHQSVNIHSCVLTQKGKGRANILSYNAGGGNGEKERCRRFIELFLDHPGSSYLLCWSMDLKDKSRPCTSAT